MGGDPSPITISNISLGGALIAAGTRYPMGQRVTISFVIPTLEEAIEVGATIRWSDDKATGLQFDGLRAREVWALNKYFEQLPALP
ncbi:MAG TPA: PilZ domain-containing protein [Kofleriaceae bacterium]|nr:PilZ domain-containing protein [Kofleriaceae bacterium]